MAAADVLSGFVTQCTLFLQRAERVLCFISLVGRTGRKKRLAPCSTGAGTQPWSRRERDWAARADLAHAEFSQSDSSPTGLMPTEGINSELCSLLHPRAISTDTDVILSNTWAEPWSQSPALGAFNF